MQNFLGTLSQFYDNATGLFGMPDISFSFVDIVEILIISFLFYHILLWIKNTRAWNPVSYTHLTLPTNSLV